MFQLSFRDVQLCYLALTSFKVGWSLRCNISLQTRAIPKEFRGWASAAMHQKLGEQKLWNKSRPQQPSTAAPMVVQVWDGRGHSLLPPDHLGTHAAFNRLLPQILKFFWTQKSAQNSDIATLSSVCVLHRVNSGHHLKKHVLGHSVLLCFVFCMFVCFVFVFVLVGFILLRRDLSESFRLSRESIHIPGWPQTHILLPQPPKCQDGCHAPPHLDFESPSVTALSLPTSTCLSQPQKKEWNSFRPRE